MTAPRPKLAVATIAWGPLKRVEELVEIANYVKSLGVDGLGIEYRLLPKELRGSPEKLKKILEDAGLENAGSYSTIKSPPLEWVKRSGTRLLWVVSRERNCEKADEELLRFTSTASSEGIVVALHNHLRTCYEDLEDLERVLRRSGELRICLDTAHAYAAGLDLKEILETYGNRIAMVHLKDLREKLPKSRVRFKRDFVNIGQGIIDFEGVLKLLRAQRFNGYIVLEIEALGGRDPGEVVAEGVEEIKGLIDRI